ncbi:ATP-binding protein [Primorskyibacter aestuariivivens]|uniref:ATP-binding protein n=1 Tax=Primorskyibacter aestuariivivens TaxID=1888912 RepID=UPI002300EF47|nr:ATP-binding protein [Primorskyibacter aestuariivivens]MDA7429199.1 ATP-binding protein [Primorskyibacter aestuariivivens]
MIRQFWPQSVGAQLLVMLLLALGISQGLSLLVFSDERDRAVRAALGYEAAGRAANVAQLLDQAPEGLRSQIVLAANSPLVRFWIDDSPAVDHDSHDAQGIADRLRRTLGDPPREVLVEIHDRTDAVPGVEDVPNSMRQMHAAMLAERTGPLELAMSIQLASGDWLNVRSMFHRPVAQWLVSDIAALAIAAILVTFVAVVTAVRIVRPMRKLANASDRAGKGEQLAALPESGPQELRDTVRAFNRMQARIRRFVSGRTRMLAALGHDLRSPLTAMRLRLELIDESEDRDRLEALVDEMQTMVEATLAFARGEAETEETVAVDLRDLLQKLVAETKGVRIDGLGEAAAVVARVRPVALKRALRNLIDNAVRYGENAEVGLLRDRDAAIISISDNGPGLPEDQLEAVFEPFRRLETSRSRDTGGTGLGLAIARTVIRAHGGEVTLQNRKAGGLKATVELPL